MKEFRKIFLQASRGEVVHINCGSPRAANNIRQRMYRFRNKIRLFPSDSLNEIIENLQFELDDKEVVVRYINLMENVNVYTSSRANATEA